ncbi:hypothetical protein BS329_15775 [Amycolatopsis coloradensis]|uniref:HTH gntR-type domain-containing protein n=1 Tax=Amycolatopsis coloradensis TaxID=76021 RepID=A0A1R0KUF5_9PSEU|nr:GntR family transcriptional regulator [Amycolatopsis coloradensis]OLZ51721.1 hypothetical protein BS329_15775 [Amycolatopsis coloradensis]
MPPFREIAATISRQIHQDVYPEGSMLPKRSILADAFGVDENTISRALDVLQSQGLVRGLRRHGTIVLKPLAHELIDLGSIVEFDGSSYRLSKVFKTFRPEPTIVGRRRAPADVARLLGVDVDDLVLVRECLMLDPADDSRRMLASTYLPLSLVEEIPVLRAGDIGDGGTYGRLEEHGHSPLSWTREAGARVATPEETEQLAMPLGVPVIGLLYTATDPQGRVCDVTSIVMSGTRFRIVDKLARNERAKEAAP